jgi:hypothetical protein
MGDYRALLILLQIRIVIEATLNLFQFYSSTDLHVLQDLPNLLTLVKILLAETFNVSATTNYKGNNKKIIQVKNAVVYMKFTNVRVIY